MNQTFIRRARMGLGVWRLLRYQSQLCRWLPLTIAPANEHTPANEGEATRWLGNTRLGGQSHHALFVPPGRRATYRLVAPPRSRFVAWCGLASGGSADTGGIEFVATAHRDGVSPDLAARLRMTPGLAPDDRRWRRLVLDLQNREEQRIEVTLAIRGESNGGIGAPSAFWGEPLLEWRRPMGELRGALRGAGRLAGRGRFIAAARILRGHLSEGSYPSLYQAWLREHSLSPVRIEEMRKQSSTFSYRPLVSVITPVYNTDPRWLRACIESVKSQAYPNWQLCLADDGSTRAETRALLREYEGDPRITIKLLATNRGIAAASNEALTLAEGEFVAFLDHDDELTSDALFEAVALLNRDRDADFIYSDEDKLELDGTRTEVYFKPDWSPDHFLTNMYTCHLMVVRRALVERVGGFRQGYEGAQDYDLVLRLIDRTSRIHHVPKVLYQWRRLPESAAGDEGAKPQAHDAGQLALEDYVRRNELDAEILPGALRHLYRVRYRIKGEPLVSIVLPAIPEIAGRDGRSACERTLAMLAERTTYRRFEVVVPVERDRPPNRTLQAPPDVTVREAPMDAASIRGRLRQQKRAAADATGEHLLFLDWGLVPISGEWLTALLEFSQQSAIGAVGAKLHYSDGSLKHIGLVLGVNGPAAPAFHLHPRSSSGYWGTAIAVRNYSAVSGDCLMTRREVYNAVGGFDDEMGGFADVDYCLRLGRAGYRVVFTPHASLVQDKSSHSDAHTEAHDATPLQRRWRDDLARDPYYNPNFSRDTPDYELHLIARPVQAVNTDSES
jgi:GT2 family glycosyltransferase